MFAELLRQVGGLLRRAGAARPHEAERRTGIAGAGSYPRGELSSGRSRSFPRTFRASDRPRRDAATHRSGAREDGSARRRERRFVAIVSLGVIRGGARRSRERPAVAWRGGGGRASSTGSRSPSTARSQAFGTTSACRSNGRARAPRQRTASTKRFRSSGRLPRRSAPTPRSPRGHPSYGIGLPAIAIARFRQIQGMPIALEAIGFMRLKRDLDAHRGGGGVRGGDRCRWHSCGSIRQSGHRPARSRTHSGRAARVR